MTENPRVVSGDDRHLRRLDRPVQNRRLPHRHRAACEPRILAGLRPRDAGAGAGERHPAFPHLRRGRGSPAPTCRRWREHTIVDRLPAVLDFAFRQAVIETVAGTRGTDAFEALFDGDVLYAHGVDTAAILPTFTGNHDDGRFAHFVRKAPSQGQRLRRSCSAGRTVERDAADAARRTDDLFGRRTGLRRHGGDQDSRQDMFASKVASYNAATLVGIDQHHRSRQFRRTTTRCTARSPRLPGCAPATPR